MLCMPSLFGMTSNSNRNHPKNKIFGWLFDCIITKYVVFLTKMMYPKDK